MLLCLRLSAECLALAATRCCARRPMTRLRTKGCLMDSLDSFVGTDAGHDEAAEEPPPPPPEMTNEDAENPGPEIPPVEDAVLDELSAAFPEEDRNTLARFFYYAGERDMATATKKLTAHLAWRKENLPVDRAAIFQELETHKLFRHSVDRHGHPVLYFCGLRHVISESLDIEKLFISVLEDAIASMREGIHRVLFMLFLPKGSPLDTKLVGILSSLFSDQYPGRVWRCLIFPTGFMTHWIWPICSVFLSRDSRAMVRLLPSEGGRQPKELRAYVAPEELLDAFGGLSPEEGGRNAEEEVQELRRKEAAAPGWFG
eukprot:TRINITY_DN9740_c0_g1_i3.p1 TRINITY_DN9740_c0_g1~~TRINITY_DN9740_c0_g1_i3.p1  ORF type:complete len:315 (-),score=54.06 TRINITY_DN9740_c0_g1_i3:55-999(-)